MSRSLVPLDPQGRAKATSEPPTPAVPARVDMIDAAAAKAQVPARKRRQAAIALKHNLGQEAAPRVVAKGYGAVAEKIMKLAFDNDVRVRHDPDLIEVLAAVEVDCEIPIEAFAAVAEILSYVYQANGQMPPGEKSS